MTPEAIAAEHAAAEAAQAMLKRIHEAQIFEGHPPLAIYHLGMALVTSSLMAMAQNPLWLAALRDETTRRILTQTDTLMGLRQQAIAQAQAAAQAAQAAEGQAPDQQAPDQAVASLMTMKPGGSA